MDLGINKLIFRDLRISDKDVIDRVVQYADCMSCQVSFANLYCLAAKYNTKICIADGIVYIKQERRDEEQYASYLFPMIIPEKQSEDDVIEKIRMAILNLSEHAHSEGKNLSLFGVTEDMVTLIKSDTFLYFRTEEKREWSDYIYLSKEMLMLSGKHLASKRKKYNIFMRQYGAQLTIERITNENISEIQDFQRKWMKENMERNAHKKLLLYENEGIQCALKSFNKLGLEGIILYIDGVVAAYSYGYPMTNKVFDVIVEKADYKFPNIYRAINQQFVKYCCMEYPYINREEDLGIQGLRKAKLAYQPEQLIKKYNLYEEGIRLKEIIVEADTKNLEQVLKFINEKLEIHNCSEREKSEIDIAVEEIYVNIASYAYGSESGKARIQCEIAEEPLQIIIQFLDNGKPYNPLNEPEPDISLGTEERREGGLGIHLVKHFMTSVEYSYVNGKNILTIKKELK